MTGATGNVKVDDERDSGDGRSIEDGLEDFSCSSVKDIVELEIGRSVCPEVEAGLGGATNVSSGFRSYSALDFGILPFVEVVPPSFPPFPSTSA